MANKEIKNSIQDIVDKDQERLLKQKLKALGIDEKCIKILNP
jgi:hypothetical protein